MNNYLSFISNDLKIVFRDKTLLIMFFLPFILVLVCRTLVPYIGNYVPEIDEYYWLIIAGFCILSGSTPAFLTAFLMLDEKDEHLIQALKIVPLSYHRLIYYRISFLMLTSFIFSILFLFLNGLEYYSFTIVLIISILTSFVPAILLMLIIPFAKNKIEGVTLFKGINILLFVPIIAFFIAPEWKSIFGIIPFFWIYEIIKTNSQNIPLATFLMGLLVNGAYFFLLTLFFNKTFIKKVDY